MKRKNRKETYKLISRIFSIAFRDSDRAMRMLNAEYMRAVKESRKYARKNRKVEVLKVLKKFL